MKPFLKAHPEGVLIFLKVQPRASKNEIREVLGNELKLKVTAPPVDSAANLAVAAFLAEKFGRSISQILLVRGESSRHKTFLLKGLTLEEIERGFGP